MQHELHENTHTPLPPVRIPFVQLATATKEKAADAALKQMKEIYLKSEFILGQAVEEFEKRYAPLTGCQYAVAVNSGTDALYLSLRALGIGPGDEVITASNSFIATAAAISLVGATPVFVDCGWDYNINPHLIESAITRRTKAIMPVHLTGLPCRMNEILAIVDRHDLSLIEDSAQAVGSTFNGQKVGSFGDTGCFSLHPLKNLHVWGDGGVISTHCEDLARELKQQRNHGLKNRDEVEYFSYNSRLDTLQAVVGIEAIPLLEDTITLRRKNAAQYDARLKKLAPHLSIPQTFEGAFHSYHLYVIAANDRDALQVFLRQNGVETKIHYPIPIHLQKAAEGLGYLPGSLPVTEALSKRILSLPIRESLKETEIDEICDLIGHFYASASPSH